MSAVAIPILLMVALVLGEAYILNRTGREKVDWHDIVFNLNSGHLVLWFFRGLELACYAFIFRHFCLGWVDKWPTVIQWLFAIMMWDFCFYWLHRLHHKFAILWAVHVVHHEGEHFNLSLAVRNSWYSSLASVPFFVPMAILGVPLPIFIAVSVLHYSIQLMNHSALTPNLGWLERVLVTPAHHRIHHVADRTYSDSNYGGSFVFWDKLFGTYRESLPAGPFVYGIKERQTTRNPLVASNVPFVRYLRLRQLKDARRKPDFRSSGLYVLIATVILFALVTGYIWLYGYEHVYSTVEQTLLFMGLALGAVALGGISDGRRWALVAWAVITWAMLLCFVVHFGWHDVLWLFGMSALCVHSSAMLLGYGRETGGITEKEKASA